MTLQQWLGAGLIALPFVAVAAFTIATLGIRATLGIFATTALIIVVVGAGVTLFMGGG